MARPGNSHRGHTFTELLTKTNLVRLFAAIRYPEAVTALKLVEVVDISKTVHEYIHRLAQAGLITETGARDE